jgi:hypothetical protein
VLNIKSSLANAMSISPYGRRNPTFIDFLGYYIADYFSNEFRKELKRSRGWEGLAPLIFLIGAEGYKAGVNGVVYPQFSSAFASGLRRVN